MAKSADDFKKECIIILNIYIKSVDHQILTSSEGMKPYLDGFKEACKGVLKDIEKNPTQ